MNFFILFFPRQKGVNAGKFSNMAELKQFFKEDLAKTFPQPSESRKYIICAEPTFYLDGHVTKIFKQSFQFNKKI